MYLSMSLMYENMVCQLLPKANLKWVAVSENVAPDVAGCVLLGLYRVSALCGSRTDSVNNWCGPCQYIVMTVTVLM